MAGPVIVGVDGSATSRAAAATAARLAAALELPLRVVAVYDRDEVEVIEVGSDVIWFSTSEEAERIASAVLAEVAPDQDGEAATIHGKPADGLVEEARRTDASILVVGNRRMQGVGRVLGSVANSVSHHAPCDVYIVKTT